MSNHRVRVALVGTDCVLGAGIKTRLEAAGYPGEAIETLDTQEQIGLVTEYGEQAHGVLEAAEDSVRSQALVCFCGDPTIAERFAPLVRDSGGVAIDCTGAWMTSPDARRATLDNAAETMSAPGIVAVCHPGTLLLAALGRALGKGMKSAAVTLLLPASETAADGPDELARQAGAFLSLEDSPERVFGRRLVFDAYPDTDPIDSADLLAAQLRELGLPTPALCTLRVSVFHGLAASVHLPIEADRIRLDLDRAGLALGESTEDGQTIDSPARSIASAGLVVASVRDDHQGGSWLWAVLDNHRATAEVAIALIDACKQA